MSLSPKVQSAIETILSQQEKGEANKQAQREQKRQIEEFGFLREETDPLFLASPAASLRRDDVALIQSLPVVLPLIQKAQGPRGERGLDGKDGESIVGPVGPAGKNGNDGKTGPKGEKGDPGHDAVVDTAELRKLAEAPVKEHEKRFKHEDIHSSYILAGKTVNIEGLEDKDVLEYDKSKDEFRFVKAKKPAKSLGLPVSSGSRVGRTIYSISTNTTADNSYYTDYVYLISGTTTLTMPTAVSNTNRYTLKNSGVATVTIDFTGGQTGDGSSTLTLTPNTSLDLISNDSNWLVI